MVKETKYMKNWQVSDFFSDKLWISEKSMVFFLFDLAKETKY